MSPLELRGGASIQQMTDIYNVSKKPVNAPEDGLSFEEVLQSAKSEEIAASGPLKFSKHANERMRSRSIDLSEEQLERLNGAVQKAGIKGINESLVMMDNIAFIVNIKNNTVVTAVSGDEERIFSNIDGAVIA